MAFAMEEETVAPDPGHVGFLGPTAVVAGAQSGADAVEQARLRRGTLEGFSHDEPRR